MPYEPVLGQIMPVAFNVIPKGWALCNGALMSIVQNQALFSLFGTYYGGDGTRTFALPDLRGRAVFGASGTTVMGRLDGIPGVTLPNSQLAQHNHSFAASTAQGTGRGAVPAGHLFGVNTLAGGETIFGLAGSGDLPIATGTNVTAAGGGQAHNNMQPYLTINYMVALQGIYPSRN